jgi:hypothetical protein
VKRTKVFAPVVIAFIVFSTLTSLTPAAYAKPEKEPSPPPPNPYIEYPVVEPEVIVETEEPMFKPPRRYPWSKEGTYHIGQDTWTEEGGVETVGVYAGLYVTDVDVYPHDSEPFSGYSSWIRVWNPIYYPQYDEWRGLFLQIGWVEADEWDFEDWEGVQKVVGGGELQPNKQYIFAEREGYCFFYPEFDLHVVGLYFLAIVYNPQNDLWVGYISWGTEYRVLGFSETSLGVDKAPYTGVFGEVRVGAYYNGWNRYVWVDDTRFRYIKVAFQTRPGWPEFPYWEAWTSDIPTTVINEILPKKDKPRYVDYYGTWKYNYYDWTFHTKWA